MNFDHSDPLKDIASVKEKLAELSKVNQRLELLRTVDHAIALSNLNEDAVNEIAMQGIIQLIPCDEVELITFHFEKKEAHLEASIYGGKFDATAERKLPLDLFDLPFYKQGKADIRNIDSQAIHAKSEEVLLERGIHNIMQVPMLDHGELIGLFLLLSSRQNHFEPPDLQIAEDIAGQITINLRQRKLNRWLQRYTSDLEKQVESRTSQLQAILNAVPDLIFRIDRHGTFLESHFRDSKELLLPEDQFIGKNIRDVMPPAIAEKSLQSLDEVFSTGNMTYFEYEMEVNGMLRSFESRIVALSGESALSIIRDITERKKAEHTLRWNESLLQKMTGSSPLAFFVVDNRTDEIIYFTPQFCAIWGITHLEERMRRGELKNNDIIPDCLAVLKDIPAFAESCKPLQDEHNQVVVEDEIPFNDGRTIRRFTAQIRGEQDEYFGRLYIFEDITRRKTTEQFILIQRDLASRHSEISTIPEAMTLALSTLMKIEGVDCGAIYLIDPTSGGLDIIVHHGLSDDFIANTSHYDPDSLNTILVKKGSLFYFDQNETELISTKFLRKEGLLSLMVLPMQHEGEVNGCINLASRTRVGFYEKVNFSLEALAIQIGGTIARINAEIALKQSQQNFQELFDTLDDFMFILDAEGRIIKTNPVVRKRLEYTEEELNLVNVLMVHPPERRDEAGFIVNEMIHGRALFCPVPLITKSGMEIPVETRVVIGKWDGKDVLFGISRDITERKKYEEVLRQGIEKEKELNQLKSKFISVASHEFRTPLATIMATSETLLSYRDRMTQPQQDERLIKIKEQVSNLNKIIDEMLHLSKLQTKEKELKPEMFDIAALTREIMDESKVYSSRKVEIELITSSPIIEVMLDKMSIRGIISNLVSNSVKYSNPGTTIVISLKEENMNVILKVQDEGMGIPENQLALLFTPFFRASNAGDIDGTGLGLSIVKESAERHGGEVSVKSKVGEGTQFTVRVPRILTT
jgi:PAS domain S-box-containing protein